MRKSVWVGSKTESRKSGAPVGRAAGGRSRLLLCLRSLEKNFYCFQSLGKIDSDANFCFEKSLTKMLS